MNTQNLIIYQTSKWHLLKYSVNSLVYRIGICHIFIESFGAFLGKSKETVGFHIFHTSTEHVDLFLVLEFEGEETADGFKAEAAAADVVAKKDVIVAFSVLIIEVL